MAVIDAEDAEARLERKLLGAPVIPAIDFEPVARIRGVSVLGRDEPLDQETPAFLMAEQKTACLEWIISRRLDGDFLLKIRC